MAERKYNNMAHCEGCGKRAMCQWESTGPLKGIWLCTVCLHEADERIANIVKAVTRTRDDKPE